MDKPQYKRILLIRTDRLGDAVLTTPAIKAMRNAYPDAYIAMMVRPYTEPAVRGNPYLNEVIVYDKHGRHKSILSSIRFAAELKKKNFDVCIAFNPTNRAHIITFLAGIPKRIGYDGNFSFCLTDRIKNTKYEGKMHELEYNLNMLKPLGIESEERQMHVPVDKETVEYIDILLQKSGVERSDKVVTVHPGASCLSKIWPSERFAKLADKLIGDYGVKVAVIGGEDKRDMLCVNNMRRHMQRDALFLSGILNVPRLTALLKRSVLFISNDSGPVHVAVCVKTPVVAVFGRSQPGLSPTRWGPLGPHDVVLHKDVGCSGICLAHNCRREFKCLKAISVEDVFLAIKGMGILNE